MLCESWWMFLCWFSSSVLSFWCHWTSLVLVCWHGRDRTYQMNSPTFQTCTIIWCPLSAFLPLSSSLASLCPFCCCTKGENNEGGRCSDWPDNVKVFKGPNEEVLVLTCEGGPLSTLALSVHSNPCPAAQHSDRAAVTACRPMADLHTPSVPKQADVSLRQPPRSDALLRQLKAAQGHTRIHRWSLNYKQKPNRKLPVNVRERFLKYWMCFPPYRQVFIYFFFHDTKNDERVK